MSEDDLGSSVSSTYRKMHVYRTELALTLELQLALHAFPQKQGGQQRMPVNQEQCESGAGAGAGCHCYSG